MTPDLFQLDVTGAMDTAAGPGGLAAAQLDALVGLGRRVHDDLLLARARGQVGFGDLYMLGREAMRARDAAETLAPRYDNVAVLAQGAEADVANSILGTLAHPFHNLLPRAGRAGRPRVFLVESIDADCLGACLDAFAVEQSLFVCMGKRGNDIESLVQFGIVRDVLRKRLGPSYQDHLVVVSDPKGGTLREEALREGLLAFEIPGNVPARFSALTPVGLLPGAMAGVDVRGVLSGAHAAAERMAGEDLRQNPAYLLASVLHLFASERGRRTHVFAATARSLLPMATHLARLFAESLETRPVASEGGTAAAPASHVTPVSLLLPRDHGLLAQLTSAPRSDTVVVLLELVKSARDRPLPKDAPGVGALGGRSMHEIVTGATEGVRRHLAEQRTPVVTLRLPALAPNHVGALHMATMLSAAFASGLAAGGAPVPPSGEGLRRAMDEQLGR
jgi:glucose-6-phosphate isomerase